MAALITLLLPLRKVVLEEGHRMMRATSSAVVLMIARDADGSFEAVCLFSLLGLTLSLAFSLLAAGY